MPVRRLEGANRNDIVDAVLKQVSADAITPCLGNATIAFIDMKLAKAEHFTKMELASLKKVLSSSAGSEYNGEKDGQCFVEMVKPFTPPPQVAPVAPVATLEPAPVANLSSVASVSSSSAVLASSSTAQVFNSPVMLNTTMPVRRLQVTTKDTTYSCLRSSAALVLMMLKVQQNNTFSGTQTAFFQKAALEASSEQCGLKTVKPSTPLTVVAPTLTADNATINVYLKSKARSNGKFAIADTKCSEQIVAPTILAPVILAVVAPTLAANNATINVYLKPEALNNGKFAIANTKCSEKIVANVN